jgi:hypothetical protein
MSDGDQAILEGYVMRCIEHVYQKMLRRSSAFGPVMRDGAWYRTRLYPPAVEEFLREFAKDNKINTHGV